MFCLINLLLEYSIANPNNFNNMSSFITQRLTSSTSPLADKSERPCHPDSPTRTLQGARRNTCTATPISSITPTKKPFEQSSTLINDYNAVLTLVNELQSAIDGLVAKIDQVCEVENMRDSIHERLMGAIGGKIEQISRKFGGSLAKLRPDVVAPSKQQPEPLFSRETKGSLLTISRSNTTSQSSLLIAQYKTQADLSADESCGDRAKKRRTCISLTGESESTESTQEADPQVPPQSVHKPTNIVSSLVEKEGGLAAKNRSDAKKTNFFDIIFELVRLNFIDKEQARVLKRLVVKKDDGVLAPLQLYKEGKDLQVLIRSIGTIIDDCGNWACKI